MNPPETKEPKMKPRTIENNAGQVFTQMCAHVLANAPRGHHPRSVRSVALAADHAGTTGSPGFLRLEFTRGNAQAEISVDFRGSYGCSQIEQEGALYAERRLETSVGWSSSGSSTPAASLVKAALFTEVALFAAELEQSFGEQCFEMIQTKDEREAENAKRALVSAENALKALCQTALKGKRVGTNVNIPAAELPAEALAALLADRTSASTANGKTFFLAFDGDARANATVNAETIAAYRMPNAR